MNQKTSRPVWIFLLALISLNVSAADKVTIHIACKMRPRISVAAFIVMEVGWPYGYAII
jgi:hypothetical protein